MKKTNKTFKRFAAITSASLLAACAVMPAFTFADEITGDASVTEQEVTTYSITINNSKSGHTYEAYQIFTGNISGEGESKVLSNIKWGANVTSYNSNNVTLGSDASTVAESLTQSNIENFIDALVLNGDPAGTATSTTGGDYRIEDLVPGYYLIKDLANSLDNANDVYTKYIVKVVGDAEANPKGDLPTVEKKVEEDDTDNLNYQDKATYENSKNAWNDVADYSVGDAVPFKLYGTLPDNLADYSAYYYKFTDTLAEQFDMPTEMIIKIGTTTYTARYDESQTKWDVTNGDGQGVETIKVNNTDDGFTVEFNNIKPLIPNVDDDSDLIDTTTVVTVEYDAVLNANAIVGVTGQKNEVDLTYSNNPNEKFNGTGTPDDIGKTPKDDVIVHTYAIQLNKEFYNKDSKLELTEEEFESGVYNTARFTLSAGTDNSPLTFRKLANGEEGYGIYDYVLDTDTNPDNDVTNLELTQIDTTETDGEGNTIKKLVIRIKGLDEGVYTLRESEVPSGFNKAPDMKVEIIAGTNNGQNGTANSLASFSYKIDDAENATLGSVDDAKATLTMQNRQGSSLPSTGGIGTTIFYLGGGAMAAIGGIYLISKRRMRKSEE